MKHLSLLAAVALLCACSSSPDPVALSDRAERSLQAEFDRLDADGSGDVTAAEINAARVAQFERLDEDGSGNLNRMELMAMRRAMPREERREDSEDARPPRNAQGKMQGGGQRGGRRGGRTADPRATMDSNGDGVVSLSEFVGRGERFLAQTDFDGDGSVTSDELRKGLVRAREEAAARRR